MIPRYTRPEMAAIWDPQTRFRIWFEVEAHAADAMAELGIIPKEAARIIIPLDSELPTIRQERRVAEHIQKYRIS